MEKISVIIPAYNSAKYIAEAIESVLNQTYPVLEVIVVDDGSTDDTAEIVKKIASRPMTYELRPKIRYFYQDNRGPAAARNRGIREARGNYIAFLDSDDLWLPDKIEKQIVLFDRSDYAMVYCDMSHVVNGKTAYKSYLKGRGYKYFGRGDIYDNLLRENFIFTPTVIMRRCILDKIKGFDEKFRICEDYKMWLSIAREYPIGYIDEPLVIRRRAEANITENRLLYSLSSVKLLKELKMDNKHDSAASRVIAENLRKNYSDLGYWYWKKKDILRAIPCIIASRLSA
jgi:teichuronic acid biosynthesis glycosyltransferase TuaG